MRGHSWAISAALILMILECEMGSSALSDDSQTSKISAEIILNQLRNDQPVIYDNAEIVDDLVLSPSRGETEDKAQKQVNSSIIITNSTLHGGIYSDQVLLTKPVIIAGCKIEGDVHLRDVSFLDLSSFNSTIFQKEAGFERVNFSRDAHFKNSTFQAEGNFNGSTFMREANFDEAYFDAARFTDCQFRGYSRFGETIFQEFADFEGSGFTNGASFNQAQFNGKAFLGWANFNGKTYFTESNFRDPASFSGSSFGDTYFNGANFVEEASFLNSSFNGNVSFAGTRFQKDAIFYKANFSSSINLNGCDYNKLVLHWRSIRDHIRPNEKIYNGLIENYKSLIWISDVSECYFDLRHWKQSTKSWTDITKIPDIFLEWYCGYGTKPLNTLFWISFSILIFGFYYWSKGGVSQIIKPGQGGERISLVAKRVSEDTFAIEYTPDTTYEKPSDLRSLLLSLKFSLFIMASKDADDLKVSESIKWQIIELERWLGRGLFVILMYYWGSLVISYFTPQP